MPVVTSYTEQELADYMRDILGDVAVTLEWTDTDDLGNYKEAIQETLQAYGISTIDQAIDVRKLRTIARREVWRAVMMATASNYRFGSDREQYFRQQFHEQAKAQFAIASTDASIYELEDARYNVQFIKINDLNDPFTYKILDDE